MTRKPTPFTLALRPLLRLLLVMIIGVAVSEFGFTTVRVDGASMEPSLFHRDRVWVSRLQRWWPSATPTLDRGDIIYFRPPGAAPQTRLEAWRGGPFVIKRVVGLPGETLRMEQGQVWIGGLPIAEPYLDAGLLQAGSHGPVVIPAGHVFVLGDNRLPLASRDSRAFGPVPQAGVAGTATLVVWPLWRRHDTGWRWNVGAR